MIAALTHVDATRTCTGKSDVAIPSHWYAYAYTIDIVYYHVRSNKSISTAGNHICQTLNLYVIGPFLHKWLNWVEVEEEGTETGLELPTYWSDTMLMLCQHHWYMLIFNIFILSQMFPPNNIIMQCA